LLEKLIIGLNLFQIIFASMQQKATVGQLQLTHNDLRRLLLGHTVKFSVENSRKVNFILELSLEQFDSIAELAEFIRAIGMDEPPEISFDY
jgi:hypothetical protein